MLDLALRLALATAPEAAQPPPEDVQSAPVDVPSVPEAPAAAVPEAPPAVAPVAPVVPPKLAAPAPASPPIDLPLPRRRGTGLFIAGGILGAAWVSLKAVSTVIDLRLAARIDRGEYDDSICIESCYSGWGFNAISAPVLPISVALVGGGMHVHGRWTAFRDVRRDVPHDLRRTRRRIGLGFGLIGAGLGTFVVSRIALLGPRSETGVVVIRELGWWLAAGGLYAGSMLAGHGHGHRVGRRKAEAQVRVRVRPVLSRREVGVGVVGYF